LTLLKPFLHVHHGRRGCINDNVSFQPAFNIRLTRVLHCLRLLSIHCVKLNIYIFMLDKLLSLLWQDAIALHTFSSIIFCWRKIFTTQINRFKKTKLYVFTILCYVIKNSGLRFIKTLVQGVFDLQIYKRKNTNLS